MRPRRHYTVNDALDNWLSTGLDGLAPATVKVYGGTIAKALREELGTVKLTSLTIVSSVETTQLACPPEPTKGKGPGGGAAPGGGASSFTVESGGNGRFTVRWVSPDVPDSCWRVTVRTIDGSALSATFRLR